MNFKKYHVSKNLLNNTATDTESNGVRITINPDKSITINGRMTSGTATYFNISSVKFTSGKEYTISGVTGYTAETLQIFTESSTAFPAGNRLRTYDGAITRTASGNETCTIRLYVYSGATYENVRVYPFICEGSTPQPYEPYSSEVWHDIPHYIRNTATDILTTLPADIYANDTTATVGLKGDMEQSSAPSPTIPITPSECGEKTENLFDNETASGYYDDSGVLVSDSTTSHSTTYIPVNSGATYTASGLWYVAGPVGMANFAVYEWDSNKNWLRRSNRQYPPSSNRITFTIGANTAYITLQIQTVHGNIMLNIGSTALPYEPYGYEIPISSTGQTNIIYLGEVQTTRRIKKLVLTGEETGWTNVGGNAPYRLAITGIATSLSTLSIEWYCSHYLSLATNDSWPSYDYCISRASTTAQSLQFRDTNQATLADFKTYLAQQYAAGTPVTIWYVLATPETDIVNEPLRKIGDYADEVSGITIPVTAGANTLSVDTTLQPSEVTVNYKGWHPVADVHKRENGQWD